MFCRADAGLVPNLIQEGTSNTRISTLAVWPMPVPLKSGIHSKATRSYNMSRIRSGNTKPEMLVRKFLHANGFRYRLHGGKPAAAKALAGKAANTL